MATLESRPAQRLIAANHDAAYCVSGGWIKALQLWLLAGAALVIFVPSLRGIDPWFGWLPFWLIVAPAIDLIVLRRTRVAANVGTLLARLRQRRRAARRQARPLLRRMRTHRALRKSAQTHARP